MVWDDDTANPVFIEIRTGLPDAEEWVEAMTAGDDDAPSSLYLVDIDTGETFVLDVEGVRWVRRVIEKAKEDG